MKPLTQMSIISQPDLLEIFSNIKQLRNLNRVLLNSLEFRSDLGKEGALLFSLMPLTSCLGEQDKSRRPDEQPDKVPLDDIGQRFYGFVCFRLECMPLLTLPLSSPIHALMLPKVEFLRLYIQYCSNQTRARQKLNELKKSNPNLTIVLQVLPLFIS